MTAGATGRSAAEVAAAVRAGRATPLAAVDAALEAADAAERDQLRAFVARHLSARAAQQAADAGGVAVAARRRAARRVDGGALAGVPFAAADDVADVSLPTTAGSGLLAGYVSPFEATAVARLLDAGAVLIGKTNVDAFGIGATTEASTYGATRHPADAERAPGGASGGAAAAVAAGAVRVALAIDAAGDVRRPASHCGVVGLKATYGRVSRVGLVTRAPSLAQLGVFGRCVDDAALALELASGRDPLDANTSDLAANLRAGAGPVDDGRPLRTVRVGRVRDAVAAADPDVAALIEATLVSMRDLGADVRDVTLADAALVGPTHRAVAAVEAASALARFDGVRFGPSDRARGVRALIEQTRGDRMESAVLREVLLGTHLAASGDDAEGVLRRAQAARARVSQSLVELFRDVDVLVAPVSRSVAPRLGAPNGPSHTFDPAEALLLATNLAGLPAVSVPIGRANGLPVGAHLVGRHFAEGLLVRAAAAVELLAEQEATA